MWPLTRGRCNSATEKCPTLGTACRACTSWFSIWVFGLMRNMTIALPRILVLQSTWNTWEIPTISIAVSLRETTAANPWIRQESLTFWICSVAWPVFGRAIVRLCMIPLEAFQKSQSPPSPNYPYRVIRHWWDLKISWHLMTLNAPCRSIAMLQRAAFF